MHPEGSVTRSSLVRVRLSRLSIVPALLICYAVVFNIGPFAKTTSQDFAARSVARVAVPRPQTSPDAGVDHLQSSADVAGRAEWFAQADGDVAQAQQQPINRTGNDRMVPMIPTADTGSSNAPVQQATIDGIWAPNAGSCSLRDLRDGTLATIIDREGARAGDTYCAFKKQRPMPTGWRVVAECSNSLERWTTDVRLTVKDDHLVWTSRRGRQIYTRCAPDAVMTAAR
jgi:hypothetical protein